MVKLIAVPMLGIILAVAPIGLSDAHAADGGHGPSIAGRTDNHQILVEARNQVAPKAKRRARSSKPVLVPICYAYKKGVVITPGTCISATDFCPDPARPRPFWNMLAVDKALAAPPDRFSADGTVVCLSPREAPTPVVTQREFARLPIPAPMIMAQPDPVTSHTLINIDTNFFTSPEPVTLATTLLGQRVLVRAAPSTYLWSYGDGSGLTTSSPGDRYPNMLTPHMFRLPGTFTVGLSTTFTGEFSVNGGPWQPIDGTATASSKAIQVTAEERRAVLTN